MRTYDFYEAFEQMAAGLAHEVRNPLSLVRANIELLELSEAAEESRRRFRVMRREIDRANCALTELMQLAQPSVSTGRREVVSLHKMLCGLVDTMKLTYGNTAAFYLESAAADYAVYADEEKLTRVFRNIVKNAVESVMDAHPNGGGQICLVLSEEAGVVSVAVKDNGRGLDSEAKARAAEPFYTTKSGGNGLGLFISRAAVAEHGGTLTVENAQAAGCVVTVRLPL